MNENLNSYTVSELDLYCREKQKWSELANVQAFMVLQKHFTYKEIGELYYVPTLSNTREQPINIVDDPLLAGP